MRVGDHILAIGDVNLKGMSSEQVAHVLRSQTGPSVRMILARPIDPQSVVLDETPGCAIIPTRMLPDMAEVRRRLVLAAAIQTPEVMLLHFMHQVHGFSFTCLLTPNASYTLLQDMDPVSTRAQFPASQVM